MAEKLRLSRAQIAKIVGNDPEAIKQFEKLFASVRIDQEMFVELAIQAGGAQATANEALAQLTRIADALELLATAPGVELAPYEPPFIPPAPSFHIAVDPLSPPVTPIQLGTAADVSISVPADHDVLVFDSATKLWRNVGPLLPQSGGTGTGTTFTAGSVVFVGASGVYSQDNANLFFDNTNNRLGVGTATPSETLDVDGNAIASGFVAFGDTDFRAYMFGTEATISFENSATTGLIFDRATGQYRLVVGAASVAEFSTSATSLTTPAGFKQIEVGAVDSGGTGYRMLRVTN